MFGLNNVIVCYLQVRLLSLLKPLPTYCQITISTDKRQYKTSPRALGKEATHTMSVPKVLITHLEVPEIAVEVLGKKCELIFNEQKSAPTQSQIAERSRGVDAIFWSSHHFLGKEIVDEAGPQLKVVGSMSAGVNNIDIAYLKSKGIKLSNTPKVVNGPVADVAIMLALAASRRVIEGRNAILTETWIASPSWLLGRDLHRSKIGIVGFGGIGQTIAKRCGGFEVSKIYYSGHSEKKEAAGLNATFVTFDRLLAESDFVFVACPLTEETKGMFNKQAFGKMKKTAVLVNVSRGAVVNQDDLIEALEKGSIYAAGLDVMTPEPLPKDHKLMKLKNCFVVPHIGTATTRSRDEMAELCANNILNALEGQPMITPYY